MKLILASASPRRKELLTMIGFDNFEVMPAIGEEKIDSNLKPEEIVSVLSKAKADEIWIKTSDDVVVIAADTIVWNDGKALGKPIDRNDAVRMLKGLSGHKHEVFTGVTVVGPKGSRTEAVMTSVRFKNMTDEEIEAYVDTGEPMDKAGAYGIQGRASVLIEGIEGDYFNVVGLPLCTLTKMLAEQGVCCFEKVSK